MHKALAQYLQNLQATLPADGPGFSALVLDHGEVAFELHHGLASLESGVPLSARAMYYLASESKQFMAAAVMQLVLAGRIGLDDDVCEHLPELAGFEQPFALRSLLNHSSGIPDYFQFLQCQPGRHEADYFSNREILALVARMDEVAMPTGSAHRYSNSNYILLAALVERLAGQPVAGYVKEQLLLPLGNGSARGPRLTACCARCSNPRRCWTVRYRTTVSGWSGCVVRARMWSSTAAACGASIP